MKKFLIAVIFITLTVSAGCYIAKTLEPDTKTITVPAVVYSGDTLDGICIRLAEKYGDTRNYKEISYYAQKKNNIGHYIYPGQRLYIDLEVLVDKNIAKEGANVCVLK